MQNKKLKYYKTIEGYFFIEKISIYKKKDLFKKNSLKFSYLKFGVKNIFNLYVKLMIEIIKKEIGNKLNKNNWIVISRSNFPNSYIFGSISQAIGFKIAQKLKLPYVISYPEVNVEKNIHYAKLNSLKSRQNEINKRNYLFKSKQKFCLKNKNIIFIDDIINTGLTIKTIHKSLLDYNIKTFKVFTIAKLFTNKLKFEYKLSRCLFMKHKSKNKKYLKKLFLENKIILTHKLLKLFNIL